MTQLQLPSFSLALFGLLMFACPLPTVRACLTWVRAKGHDTNAWTPGRQGSPLGICRYINLDSNLMGVEVGKWESGTFCYFTSLDARSNGGQNGTATIADGYEIAVVNPRVCSVDTKSVVTTPGASLPPNAAVAGFRSDGSVLGVCLVPDGEGKGLTD